MDIQQLNATYAKMSQIDTLCKFLEDNHKKDILLEGFIGSAAAMFFSALRIKSIGNNIVFILNDADEAGYFYNDLTQACKDDKVLFFPSSYKRAIKYGQKDLANEVLRTEVITRLSQAEENLYIVTYPEAISERVVSAEKISNKTLSLAIGQSVDTSLLEHNLEELGFELHDYVYEPGQFAMRGSIVDVFSFNNELPYRIDFFGDEIESIRTFDVVTQLSESKVENVIIVPELTSSIDKVSFFSLLKEDTIIATKNKGFVADRINSIFSEGFSKQAYEESLENVKDQEKPQVEDMFDRTKQLIDKEIFNSEIRQYKHIHFGTSIHNIQNKIIFNLEAQPLFHKNFDMLTKSLVDLQKEGYRLYILADSKKQQQRLKDIFEEITKEKNIDTIEFTPVNPTIHEGFTDRDYKICLFTDHQIFDRFHKFTLRNERTRDAKMALTMKEITELNVNDYIVHVDHGIGRFDGLVRVPNGDSYQEMVRLVYQNNDVVYVSIHSLYKISKYRGKDGEAPKISRLGTGAWQKMKDRTKKKIKDIARDLIKLYSQRKKEKGFSYSPDTYMQQELEASFLYEDTPDQLQATNDVKKDMESSKSMDRLVCGDVGFGKTEVAVRAAFKAATDGKQVAVLVPTTVLAFQHYKTFMGRLKGFPVNVEYLTRARSAKKTKEILTDLQNGKIDIIIGTHKLISKSVHFKDLGLLIIDEEQKFGVAVKEKLRQIKTNVDTLTMSATPIPRTLQFSLMGARDMSVIKTPPPNRYPIQTEVHTFNSDVIKEAIEFEMSRNGQVFFVSNRISSLPEIQMLIKKLVPDARVAIGHGQMAPDELESIIMGFINYDYDVLLSTTIVENGIDIPNANTIIINQAQHFGLSDLHQMRGRVGRSNKKAFCFLLAPPLADLNVDARRRLEAIENFSNLGSGIQLAMQDLDIRGAGNLLGSEQSGFIADLGYETYQKILAEAVTELKNEEFKELYTEYDKSELQGDMFVDDCQLDSDLDICFPESFVPNSSERVILYKQLDNIEKEEQLNEFKKNIRDRFGDIPTQAEELMRVVLLRSLGKKLGVERIVLKAGKMNLYFVSNYDSIFYQSETFDKVILYLQNNVKRCNLHEERNKRWMSIQKVKSVEEAMTILNNILTISLQ